MPPSEPPQDTGRTVRAAMFVAGATIAHLVAGKAIQNALFLSTFDKIALARMSTGSGLFSIVFFFLAYYAMTRLGPARLLPWVFGSSAVLLFGEWVLLQYDRPLAAVLIFLHLNAFSLVLISGFWSLVSERFDPRTAKTQIGRIGGAATLGGVLGGGVAFSLSAGSSLTGAPLGSAIPLLALVHGICAWQVRLVSPRGVSEGTAEPGRHVEEGNLGSGLRRILATAYLRDLALLVLLVAVAEGLIDFVFKSRATDQFQGREGQLGLVFSLFYVSVAVLAFLIQRLLSRPALQRLGLAGAVATLPLVMLTGGLGALLLPGLASAGLVRGAGAVIRDSLYRVGYELLYVPVATSDKRATKLILDVGVVRLGDVVWGRLVALIVAGLQWSGRPAFLSGPDATYGVVLAFAVGLAAWAFVMATRFHRGYLGALEKSLLARGAHLGPTGGDALTTHATLLQTMGALDLTLAPGPQPEAPAVPPIPPRRRVEPAPSVALHDPLLQQITDLRSNDAERVRTVLRNGPLGLPLVSHTISLLAWDEVSADAAAALRPLAPRVTGQLVDALLDPDTEFAVRRRLPRVLAAGEAVRASQGLLGALEDPRFEVRYRAGRALARMQERNAGLSYDRSRVLEAVLREVQVDRRLWEHRQLLDELDGEEDSAFVDQYLRDRANRALEHVFTVLSLILPREPLTIAFRGLHTDDPHLRGTALEYLESTLPDAVRVRLWPFLEDDRKEKTERTREEILESLLRSNDTIADRIVALRRKSQEGDTPVT